MKNNLYIPRHYRSLCLNQRFIHFTVREKESDLFILAKSDLSEVTYGILAGLRAELESYIELDNRFLTSLEPISVCEDAPDIVKEMVKASKQMGVGPMASVAGAISERVARELAKFSDEVIVENGGDDYIINREPVTIAIYAGESPLSMKLGLEIGPNPDGISICTSSGTVGHSLSFGNADAVTVIAKSGSLADAAATAICNMVKIKDDVMSALKWTERFPEILGIVIIMDDNIGVMGEIIRLKPLLA